MDKKVNLPEPPVTEEPPLQQISEILNADQVKPQQTSQPTQSQQPQPVQKEQGHEPRKTPLEMEPTPPERPPQDPPKKKKTWIILVIVAVLVIAAMTVSFLKWRSVNDAIDNQNEIIETHFDGTVDDLMMLYKNKNELNCNYRIAINGEMHDVSEYADDGWKSHKVTIVGNNNLTTTLMLENDAVYLWGYESGSEEFAYKVPWDKYSNIESSKIPQLSYSEKVINDSVDSIEGVTCSTEGMQADYSVPIIEWVEVNN